MKHLFFLSFFFFSAALTFAQTSAVTSNGDEVILYPDGTWKYLQKNEDTVAEIKNNPTLFEKNSKSTFLVKSNITNQGVYINAQKWSFKKVSITDDREFSFQLKGKDAYCMLIAERIEVPLEALRSVALENAKLVAPDTKITKQEFRHVNGLEVLCLQMTGSTQGIKFTYFGYYYSSDKGTVQLVAYTSNNLFDEYKTDIEDLLNGLVTVK